MVVGILLGAWLVLSLAICICHSVFAPAARKKKRVSAEKRQELLKNMRDFENYP
jgi:hypothetical protein